MAEYAKLFRNGGSQAVRLPREHRFPGDRVRITPVDGGLLLRPVYADVEEWFAAIDAAGIGESFPEIWRDQPPMPEPRAIDFEADEEEQGGDAR